MKRSSKKKNGGGNGSSSLNKNNNKKDAKTTSQHRADTTTTATTTPVPPSISLRNTRLDLGLDLGGSLTKVCFFEPYDVPEHARNFARFIAESTTYGGTGVRDPKLSFESARLGGRFHFIYFQTSRTQGAINMMKSISAAAAGRGPQQQEEAEEQLHNEIHATGGGAIKFARLVEQELGIRLVPEDELETVISGIVFTLLEQPHTCYSVQAEGPSLEGSAPTDLRIPRPIRLDDLFPLLVVNIGSGVSIIKVDDANTMRRISGTAVGGGTFYGLCKLLTRCETFEEAMDMADRGDSRRVNMLVSDIYGGSYERVGLPGSITASFFGKAASATSRARPASSGSHEDVILARRERTGPWWVRALRTTAPGHIPASVLCGVLVCDRYGLVSGLILLVASTLATLFVLFALHVRRERRHHSADSNTNKPSSSSVLNEDDLVFQDEDIARALVTMVAQNITQIAFLNAKLHHTKRIVFTGNFLRHNPIALRTLTTNLRLFSGGEVEALFMEHEGFFGALGAFLATHHAKEKLSKSTEGETMPRTSSFHAPEEGDDVFYLSSSPKIDGKKKKQEKKDAAAAPLPEAPPSLATAAAPQDEAPPAIGASRAMIDVMAELRLT